MPSTDSGAGEAERRRQEEGGSRKEERGEEEGGGGRGAQAPREAETGAAALGQRVCGQREAAGEPAVTLADDGEGSSEPDSELHLRLGGRHVSGLIFVFQRRVRPPQGFSTPHLYLPMLRLAEASLCSFDCPQCCHWQLAGLSTFAKFNLASLLTCENHQAVGSLELIQYQCSFDFIIKTARRSNAIAVLIYLCLLVLLD